MSKEKMLTIYLPQLTPDPATVRAGLAALAQAHGLGRGPGQLLVELSEGRFSLTPASPVTELNPPEKLPDLMERCATLLESKYPIHADKLRQKAKEIRQVLG